MRKPTPWDGEAFGFLSRVPRGQNRPGSRLRAWEGLSDPGQGLRRCKVSGGGDRTGGGCLPGEGRYKECKRLNGASAGWDGNRTVSNSRVWALCRQWQRSREAILRWSG